MSQSPKETTFTLKQRLMRALTASPLELIILGVIGWTGLYQESVTERELATTIHVLGPLAMGLVLTISAARHREAISNRVRWGLSAAVIAIVVVMGVFDFDPNLAWDVTRGRLMAGGAFSLWLMTPWLILRDGQGDAWDKTGEMVARVAILLLPTLSLATLAALDPDAGGCTGARYDFSRYVFLGYPLFGVVGLLAHRWLIFGTEKLPGWMKRYFWLPGALKTLWVVLIVAMAMHARVGVAYSGYVVALAAPVFALVGAHLAGSAGYAKWRKVFRILAVVTVPSTLFLALEHAERLAGTNPFDLNHWLAGALIASTIALVLATVVGVWHDRLWGLAALPAIALAMVATAVFSPWSIPSLVIPSQQHDFRTFLREHQMLRDDGTMIEMSRLEVPGFIRNRAGDRARHLYQNFGEMGVAGLFGSPRQAEESPGQYLRRLGLGVRLNDGVRATFFGELPSEPVFEVTLNHPLELDGVTFSIHDNHLHANEQRIPLGVWLYGKIDREDGVFAVGEERYQMDIIGFRGRRIIEYIAFRPAPDDAEPRLGQSRDSGIVF